MIPVQFSEGDLMTRSSLSYLVLVWILALGVFGVAPAEGQDLPPTSKEVDEEIREKKVMQVVAALLEQAHLNRRDLDDRLSHQAFDAWLDALDPLKLYFQKADVDAFRKHRSDLDDMLKAGDSTFAREAFKRLLERVDERVATVEKLLLEPFDFTVDESFVTDGKALEYPADADAASKRWRQRLKSDLLALQRDDVADEEAHERLLKRYRRFRDRMHQEDQEEIVSRFINAIASIFDPHSVYLAPKPYQDFAINVTLNYQGIGALLGEEDGDIIISRIIPGGAAEKHGGLKAKDKILGVGQGKDTPIVDVVGMKLSDVVKLVRGEEGTVIRLDVMSAAGMRKIHSLVRAKIELEESTAKADIIDHGRRNDGSPWRVGIIDLPSFYRDTMGQTEGKADFRSSARDVRAILEDFKTKKVDAVILDLRRNGGGFLPEAVEVSALFVGSGPVVQVKGSGRRVRVLDEHDTEPSWDGPVVVLTSRVSASASEIVAGAIQDYRRGVIVGDGATHGKGTVQTTLDLAEQIEFRGKPGVLGVLKLTFQQFYRPSGDSTQLRGVLTDVTLPAWTAYMDLGEADIPYALPFASIGSVRHRSFGQVDDTVLQRLRAQSADRMQKSEFFQGLQARIKAYVEFKRQKSIPLQKSRYDALQASLEAVREEQEEEEEVEGVEGKTPKERVDVLKGDPWFVEVMDITVDYAGTLLARAR
jgi:carboxyl-terminal processing protease